MSASEPSVLTKSYTETDKRRQGRYQDGGEDLTFEDLREALLKIKSSGLLNMRFAKPRQLVQTTNFTDGETEAHQEASCPSGSTSC